MPLGKSVLECDCGMVIDRDVNAAINLSKWSDKQPKVSSGVACGEFSAGCVKATKLDFGKQELNNVQVCTSFK